MPVAMTSLEDRLDVLRRLQARRNERFCLYHGGRAWVVKGLVSHLMIGRDNSVHKAVEDAIEWLVSQDGPL